MIRLSCSVYTIANDQLFCILSFSSSGICLDCQDNTQGHNCEECLPNFYQRHGEGTADACLPCPCSSESSSGSCHLGESGSLWHTDRGQSSFCTQHMMSWKWLGIIQQGTTIAGTESLILMWDVIITNIFFLFALHALMDHVQEDHDIYISGQKSGIIRIF